MKQLSWLEATPESTEKNSYVAHIDGASRNNPGKSGIGIHIQRNGITCYEQGFYVGIKTNNQAEYLALLVALVILQKWYKEGDTLCIVSDSLLLVKQMRGDYCIRNTELQKLYAVAYVMSSSMHAQIIHVLRENNKEADLLANKGIDNHVILPSPIIAQLDVYGITI